MRVFYSTPEAAGRIQNAVVTTGSFDGVHVGHKIIIGRLNELARETGGESVLITFHPHPRKVLYPDQTDLKLINTQEEKIELLGKAGLDNLIIIPFTLDFSRISSRQFVTDILVGQLKARVVVIGHNHHFGHNREGDFSYLHTLGQQLDFLVEEIPLKDIENETVSSTKIRRALLEGNIQRANAYLDHQYIIQGTLGRGEGLPGLNGTPTSSLATPEPEKLIPPCGIYATNLRFQNSWMKAMGFILEGGDGNRRVEIQLLYDTLPAEAAEATLYFYKRVMVSAPGATFPGSLVEEAREMVEDLIY
jgi:riboflavin kinase/FMN adenylyltransferase